MARKSITQIFDDLDNTPLTESEVEVIQFSVNGKDYTLDLSAQNAEKFHAALEPFVEVAQRVSPVRRTQGYSPKEVREWAAANGYEVAARGKIAQEVVDAYLAAN